MKGEHIFFLGVFAPGALISQREWDGIKRTFPSSGIYCGEDFCQDNGLGLGCLRKTFWAETLSVQKSTLKS